MQAGLDLAKEYIADRNAQWQTDPPHITKFWFHKQTGTPYEWNNEENENYAEQLSKSNTKCLPIVEDVKYPTFWWTKKGDEYQFDVKVQLHKENTWRPAILFAKKSDVKVGATFGVGGVNPWEFRMQANFGSPYDNTTQSYVCRPSKTQQGEDADREESETNNVREGTSNILWETEREVLRQAIQDAKQRIQKEQEDVKNAKQRIQKEQEDVKNAEAELAQEQEDVKNAEAELVKEQKEAQNVEKTEENTQQLLQKKLTTELSTEQELKAEMRQDEMFASKKIRTFVPSQKLKSLLNSGSRAYYRALALGQTVDGIS